MNILDRATDSYSDFDYYIVVQMTFSRARSVTLCPGLPILIQLPVLNREKETVTLYRVDRIPFASGTYSNCTQMIRIC